MFTIDGIYKAEQTIRKSKFICTLSPITNEKQARELLTEIKKKYRDASHNCYAYVWGKDGEFFRCGDDGEPAQTAGTVMAGVLGKVNLTNVLAVVTRYFGGIKLGTGGLIRAYSSSVMLAIEKASFLPLIVYREMTLRFAYSFYDDVLNLLRNGEILTRSFGMVVTMSCLIPSTEAETFVTALSDLTKGNAVIVTGAEIAKAMASNPKKGITETGTSGIGKV